MRLCVGTSKGIVILDPARGRLPLMVLADPSAIWCMSQDCAAPEVIYAGATEHVRGRGTLARSSDGGRSWTDITPSAARDEEVWAVGASPFVQDLVFVGTTHARLFRSDNRGRSFRECSGFLKIPGRERWSFPPPPHIPHVRSITFDAHNPIVVYVGVEEGGVYRSRDGGMTFESLNEGLYSDVHTVAVDPLDARHLYATTGAGFFRSEDSGVSWTHVMNGIDRSYTVPLIVNHGERNEIFTAAAAGPPPTWSRGPLGANAMIYRSDDNGMSFAPVPVDNVWGRGMIMRLRRDPEGGEFFGVTNDGYVFRASNGCSSILSVADRLPPAYDFATVA